jgi:hypothetical protein
LLVLRDVRSAQMFRVENTLENTGW